MRTVRLLCMAAVCGLLCLPAEAALYRQINGVCSAFDPQGDAAMATLDVSQIALQFTRASGATVSLSLPFASKDTLNAPGCTVFFSGDNRLVAVEVKRIYPKDSLRVAVADVAAGKWLGNFEVQQDEVLGPPVALAGFEPGSASLVVVGVPVGADKPATKPVKAFSAALLDVQGKELGPQISRALPKGAGMSQYADVKNNRLWFEGAPDPCPIRSVSLTGAVENGPMVGAWLSRNLCYTGLAPVFPDENTYVTATMPKVDAGAVWRIDLKEETGEHIDLPDVSKSGLRIDIDGNIMSPDGEIAAILRDRRSYVVFGPKGNKEIDVVQVRPLKYLGKMNFPEFTDLYSLSVDHRNGAITVLGFWDGKWQRQQLKQK